MDDIPLTNKERAHVDKGERVFIVQQIKGPLWRVLSVSQDGVKVLLKPDDAEGYSDPIQAHENALMIAALAEDKPMVRPL